MRILQVHTRYRQRGGEDVVVEAEAALLSEAGYQVRQVIAQNPEAPLAAAANLSLALWNPSWVRRIRREIEAFRPDVIHVHNTWFAMSPAALWVAKRARVAVVMTLHNYRLTCANALLFRAGGICEDCVGASPWRAVRYGCYRDSRAQTVFAAATIATHRRLRTWERYVDRFIALTEFQRDVMARAGLPGDKIVVKPNFVPDPGPRPAPPSASNVVLYVGRLSYEKGVDLLLEGWRVADTGDLELWIVGDGPMRAELRRDPPRGVRFLGVRSAAEVRALMLSARALVLPSRWYEGLPMVVVEACAAGLPIVVPRHVAIARELPDFPPSSLGDSQTSSLDWPPVLAALRDDDWGRDAGRLTRGLYEKRFSTSAALEAYHGLYHDVVGSALRTGSPKGPFHAGD